MLRFRVAGFAVLLLPLTALAGPLPSAPDPLAGLAPAVPQPQPGVAAPSCTAQVDPPGIWHAMWSHTFTGDYQAAPIPPGAAELAVDPSHPCVEYLAADGQTIQRSTDGGTTWQTVFHDTAASVQGDTFHGAFLAFPSRDHLLLGEQRNGDAMLRSDDAGGHWSLSNAGLTPQRVMSIEVAPSDPATVYALLRTCSYNDSAPPGCQPGTLPDVSTSGLAVSRDGGKTWALTQFPALPRVHDAEWLSPILRVDPLDPTHLWAVVLGQTLLESRNSGSTWSPAGTLQQRATQLVVVHDGRAVPARLFALFPGMAPQSVAYSDDDGASWTPTGPPMGGTAFALGQVPGHDRSMAVVGTDQSGELAASSTTDGFTSWTPLVRLPGMGVASYPHVLTPFRDAASDEPDLLIRADTLGRFYVPRVEAVPDPTGADPRYTVSYWRFTPLSVASGSAGGGSGSEASSTGAGSGGGASGGGCSSPGACPVLTPLKSCPVPAAARSWDSTGLGSGTLTYDGVDLLYTHHTQTGELWVPPAVHKLDPVTCADDGWISVDFPASDLAEAAAQANDPSVVTQPVIDTLAYDARSNRVWVSLSVAHADAPVFLLTIDSYGSGPLVAGHAVGRYAFTSTRYMAQAWTGSGLDFLAADWTDGTLWSTQPSTGRLAHLRPDGTPITSCIASIDQSMDPATWTLLSPQTLLVQAEDDMTLYVVSTTSCRVTGAYQHPLFREPQAEDEQMACDSLSFRQGPVSLPETVIWLRDAGSNTVGAYQIPDGSCPFPTELAYAGPSSVEAGSSLTICADLGYRAGTVPVVNRLVTFTVDGVPAGATTTTASGRACIPTHAPSSAESALVHAHFGGDASLYASDATAAVTVWTRPSHDVARLLPAAALLTLNPPTSGPPPPSGSGAQVQSAPQAEGVAQAQAQAQVQTQSQAQAQSVAQVQPGMMVQRQKRTQVALQQQAVGSQTVHQASGLRRGPAAPATAMAAATLLVGVLAALARRPRRALARRSRDNPMA